MDVVRVRLPEEIKEIIARQVAAGRVATADAYMIEAARRFAEDLAVEDEVLAEAEAGIADVEAGRYVTIATPADAEALHARTMARLRDRLAAEPGWVAYRLVGHAEARIDAVLLGSARRFAIAAAGRYHRLILAGMASVGDAPGWWDPRQCPSVRVWHLRCGRSLVAREHRVDEPRHLLVYRVAPDGAVDILSIVHDRMPVPRARCARRRG